MLEKECLSLLESSPCASLFPTVLIDAVLRDEGGPTEEVHAHDARGWSSREEDSIRGSEEKFSEDQRQVLR